MEADGTWFPTHDQFFAHPKVRRAGRDAALLFLAGLGYCSRYLTDGAVPKEAVDIIAAEAWTTKKAAAALVRERLWHDMGDRYQVNDWHEWNRTRSQAEEKKQKRAGAGAVGNHRRWHVDRGIVDADCKHCRASTPDPSPDPGSDGKSDRNAIPSKSQNGAKPVAEQEQEIDSYLDLLQQQTAVGGSATSSAAAAELSQKTVAGVVAVLMRTRRRYEASLRADNPPGWLIRTEQGIRGEAVAALPALVVEHPNWTFEQLAAAIDGTPIPAAELGPPVPSECERCAGHPGIHPTADPATWAVCDHGLLSEAS